MNDFITKPFTPVQLKQVLVKYGKAAQSLKSEVLPFKYSESLDHEGLVELYGQDVEFAFSMFGTFLSKIEEDIMALKGLVGNKDLTSVKLQAHKMKPSFQLVGLNSFSQKMKELEEHAESGDYDKVETATTNLFAELDLAIEKVKAEHQRLAVIVN